jgi:tripartite-type tricarboxylate transporter receptor subunit TctC
MSLARALFRMLSIAACAVLAPLAHAQSFPAKPVRIILPFPPGGALDTTARTVAAPMAESMGQPVLVENRPGGSTIIGMQACARAAPDGYTTCLTAADSLSYNPHLFRNLPYDAEKDFVPVIHLIRIYSLLLGKGTAPFNSFREMIATAQAKPGSLNFGTWGPASSPDIYLQATRQQKGVDIVGVPYKGGGGQAVPALLSGEIDMTLMVIGPMMPHIKAGKVKPLAIVGNQRFPGLPNVPSLAEEGVDPGLSAFWGVFAPAGVPKPVVDRLNAEFNRSLKNPKVQEFIRSQTLEAVGGTAEEFAAFVAKDRANAARVLKTIGVKPADAPS